MPFLFLINPNRRAKAKFISIKRKNKVFYSLRFLYSKAEKTIVKYRFLKSRRKNRGMAYIQK